MSNNQSQVSSTDLSIDIVKSNTEKLAESVQWIAELIQKRNWVTLLLLADMVLFFGFKPEGGIIINFYKRFFRPTLPDWYADAFWIVIVGIVLAAIAVAVRTKSSTDKLKPQEGEEHQAIKGLRAFTAEDADVFAKLQRDQSIEACLESLKAKEFRFGVLMGESGCGKTSFLQAGVLPKLNREGSACHGIYLKFTERDPIETVKEELVRAVLDAEPRLDRTKTEAAPLAKLLIAAPQVLKKPVVLFFDQFEQFFVHQRQKVDRQPFIAALTTWYQAKPLTPLRILIGIRADLLHELYELQRTMGYVLRPSDLFRLEKFEPEEAAEVLRVIAETEGWEFDRAFVTKLAKEDLISSEGKVSPVDLQILAETVRKQPASRRAFTEATFRQMGGLEGLLNRYLEQALEALKLNNLYQPAIQVLLALINREQNLRAGVLTLTEIAEKLKRTVKPNEVMQAIDWLASGDVRLISVVERQTTTGYELAHERIIPAVVRVAGEELKAAERAKQLLDRRVNEWLDNGRSRRYLLSWRELWLLQQQKAYLVWGKNRRDKERLLKQSWQRFYRFGWALLATLMLGLSGFAIWLSPPMQLWHMRLQLVGLRQQTSDDSREQAAVALAKVGKEEDALNLISSISSPSIQASSLGTIAEAYINLNDAQTARNLLEQALTTVEQMDSLDLGSKAFVLTRLARLCSRLNDAQTTQNLLKQALTTVEQMDEQTKGIDESVKAHGLGSIAQAYIQLNDVQAAHSGLKQVRIAAEQINDGLDKLMALGPIAEAYSTLSAIYNKPNDVQAAQVELEKLHNSTKQVTTENSYVLQNVSEAYSKFAEAYIRLNNVQAAQDLLKRAYATVEKIDDVSYKAPAVNAITEAYIELNDSQTAQDLLKQILTAAEKDDSHRKFHVLQPIAEAYGRLNDVQAAQAGIARILTAAGQLDDPSDKANTLWAIADAYGALDDPQATRAGLAKLHDIAQQINEPLSKARGLRAVADAYRKLNDVQAAQALLEEASTAVRTINEPYGKARGLRAVADAYRKLNDVQAAQALLKEASTATKTVGNSDEKAVELQSIVHTYAELEDWRQVNLTAALCTSNDCKADVLSTGLTVRAEQLHPELKEEEEEE